MEAGNLARWIEELDAAIERLQKRVDKIVAGGGFDPSAYVYNTPCIDLDGTITTLYRDERDIIEYTATAPCAVIFRVKIDGTAHPTILQAYVTLTSTSAGSATLRYPTYTQSDYLRGMLYLAAGQTITAEFVDNGSDFQICPILQQQLQEAPVGLLGRIARTVKNALKGR